MYREWLAREKEINIVILRRGNRDYECCNHALCPDVRVYRCFTSLWVVIIRISKGVEQRLIATELQRNGVGISTVMVAILRNDGVYIAGIKNKTRGLARTVLRVSI